MEILCQKIKLEQAPCDVLIVNEFEGVAKPGGGTGAVDQALGGALSESLKAEEFKGKEGEIFVLSTLGKIPARKVLVAGLGKKEDFSKEVARKISAAAIKKARKLKAKKTVTILHGAGIGGLKPEEAAEALVEGSLLGLYEFSKYKTKKEEHKIEELVIAQKEARFIPRIKKAIDLAKLEVQGVTLARDLTNEPASSLPPSGMVKAAQEIARKNKKIKVKIFDQTALKKMGAGGILGVAQGSDQPAFLVHLVYTPPRPGKKVALVGKGITFDSGGISIKSAEEMYTMKDDMAGAAVILGVFSVLEKFNPKVEAHGVFGVCENMPSGKAIKPGDIVKTLSGKTVEVSHTDAEGRIVLADGLTYIQKFKPDYIVDLATLTGACIAALGEQYAGIMGNNKKLVSQILNTAKISGERFWELPLVTEYKELYKSEVADMRNTCFRKGAGAIMGGMFLQEFVDPKIPWAHIDIAGPAFAETDSLAYAPKGGTGFGVRTLLHFLKNAGG